MTSLTENENWICDNCDEEMSGPECALCGEPKEGRKPNIEKIIQILKGLNMKTIFEYHAELPEFSVEVDLVYKDENPTAFFEPREDLEQESVLNYAAILLKSFDDFFQINIPEYVKLDNESKKLLYELNDNRKKHKAVEEELPNVLKKQQLDLINASKELSLEEVFIKSNWAERVLMDAEVQSQIKDAHKKHIASYEKELIKLHAIMGSLQDKWKASLIEIQKFRKESLRELFEHMKETTDTELTEKELAVIYNTAVEILGPPVIPARPKSQMTDKEQKRSKRIQFLKVESFTWLETLSGLVSYLEGKEEEDTDSWFKTAKEEEEEEEEEALAKGDELLKEEERQKEEEIRKKEKSRKRREKKKRQKTRKKEAKRAAKKAEEEALRLRAQELYRLEKEEKRIAAEETASETASTVSWEGSVGDKEMSGKVDVYKIGTFREGMIISRVVKLYRYLQEKGIFSIEREKRERKMAIVKQHQEEIIRYIKTYLIPELHKQGLSLVLTGGFATRLLSKNHYNTEDIDMKVCNAEMPIYKMRKIVKEVLEKSRGESLEEMFEVFDPIDKVWRVDAGKANEMLNDGNVALKITIPTGRKISVGGRQIDEREPIAEITFVNVLWQTEKQKKEWRGGPCDVSTTIEGIPIYSAEKLIGNLLYASVEFEDRIKIAKENRKRGKPAESIYDEKLLSWFWQLQELFRLTASRNMVKVMQNEINRVKSPSPKKGGQRKTRKRRKKRKRRRRKTRK
jgi:hypothetical protein